ncbi:hypothetical protein [Chlorogloeopsis sp. ULAP02]|uniref:hypothetical protein n=1 Tax=Chlorogloeopsis sp. ULAP02 TaxID=3107926 RepID=UPI003136EE8E
MQHPKFVKTCRRYASKELRTKLNVPTVHKQINTESKGTRSFAATGSLEYADY